MVASGRGRQVVIEQAFSIPCETDPSAAEGSVSQGMEKACSITIWRPRPEATIKRISRGSHSKAKSWDMTKFLEVLLYG